MNFKKDAEFRKRLAQGFLNEARLNFEYKLWRSCVDNSQLSIENSGKMIIALFEPIEKTHNPSGQLKRLINQNKFNFIPDVDLSEFISILDRFGIEEHFMTDYGDETTHTDPWSLFTEDDAKEALKLAEQCYSIAEHIYHSYLKKLSES